MSEILPMTDLRLTPQETQKDFYPSATDQPAYPYGLCISLCQDELQKLGIDYVDIQTGDLLHLHCLAVITSKNENQRQSGETNQRVELQITHMAGVENEDQENEEAETKMSPVDKIKKLYK